MVHSCQCNWCSTRCISTESTTHTHRLYSRSEKCKSRTMCNGAKWRGQKVSAQNCANYPGITLALFFFCWQIWRCCCLWWVSTNTKMTRSGNSLFDRNFVCTYAATACLFDVGNGRNKAIFSASHRVNICALGSTFALNCILYSGCVGWDALRCHTHKNLWSDCWLFLTQPFGTVDIVCKKK